MTTSILFDMIELNSKLDELSRLKESEYETNKTVTIFQYFDKIYTSCYGTTNFPKLMDTLIQKKYTKLCYPIFKHIHTNVFKTETCWHITYYLLHSLWNYTDKTNPMCFAVIDAQFLSMFIPNLNNEIYLKYFSSNDAIKKLFEMIVSIMHNIAQVSDLVDELRRSSCIEALTRVVQTVASCSVFLKGISYLTLAYIIREDERAHLANSNESIPYLVGLLHEAVNTSDRRSHGLDARELCKGLSKLSVANDNKHKIFSETKLIDSLLNMLEQHTNSQEQISACTLIWNLCFDQNVRKAYNNQQKLNQILTTIAQTSSNDELRRTASGCLCTLMGGPTATAKASSSSSSSSAGNKTIMISYNHDVQQLSKQIKDQLAADGYDVWIDVESMHGNILDAMSDAIESSTIFLMCLTEKYKDSPSCRLECEYAYQRKKHIIPLLLQANYKPDGWLGIILGSKLYINYAKKPFEAAYSETLGELQATMNPTERKPTVPPVKKHAPPPQQSSTIIDTTTTRTSPSQGALAHLMSQFRIDKQSETMSISLANLEKLSITDTQRLLAENGLEKFMPIFLDVDGVKLIKLFEIKNKAPQCYYMLIKDQWDLMNQVKERSRDSSSPPARTSSAATSMAQYLQLTIALDKLADRFAIN
ncbi:unnamed protein product [Rotaria socialis]|uniref:TIR domain-containing protein n=1 Tax=Rotaria socialis TaxID=392032 RepID=A0A818HAN4_9BILA|nr:unnamed protein product [Rotaria socialis]CAF3504953.1 unnamed protein product [Rotaria socialis]CAF4119491.1 unnamed protein product [Rotaria socialis]CAF4127716.1 unnamed protein product [Rotaria socialis]